MKITFAHAFGLAGILAGAGLRAQQTLNGPIRKLNPTAAVQKSQAARVPILVPSAPKLPLWQYEIVATQDLNTYRGSIVGGNPYKRGARTTTVPVVLIPLRVVINNLPPTAGVTSVAFDPTSPDSGILGGGNTALSLTKQSDQFTPTGHTINGVNMGTGVYADAFQRASFWPLVQQVSPAYHLAFSVTEKPKQTITLPFNSADGTVYNLNNFGASPSVNPITADNPRTYIAAVSFDAMDSLLRGFITTLGIQPNQFPLFLVYGVVMTDGPANQGACCILGYHNGDPNPANPGQTYGIATYEQNYAFFGHNTATLSHEISEWINDPSIRNLTPPWQVFGPPCQGNLETGDPLAGFEVSGITMPNGVAYYSQEQAYFSWFFGGPFKGAGDVYSSDGSFTLPAVGCAP